MNEGIPHVMPVKKRSKEMKQLLKGRRSRFAKYTMNPMNPITYIGSDSITITSDINNLIIGINITPML